MLAAHRTLSRSVRRLSDLVPSVDPFFGVGPGDIAMHAPHDPNVTDYGEPFLRRLTRISNGLADPDIRPISTHSTIENRNIESYASWLVRNGVRISKIDLVETTNRGIGVYAASDIAKDETIAAIPVRLVLCSSSKRVGNAARRAVAAQIRRLGTARRGALTDPEKDVITVLELDKKSGGWQGLVLQRLLTILDLSLFIVNASKGKNPFKAWADTLPRNVVGPFCNGPQASDIPGVVMSSDVDQIVYYAQAYRAMFEVIWELLPTEVKVEHGCTRAELGWAMAVVHARAVGAYAWPTAETLARQGAERVSVGEEEGQRLLDGDGALRPENGEVEIIPLFDFVNAPSYDQQLSNVEIADFVFPTNQVNEQCDILRPPVMDMQDDDADHDDHGRRKATIFDPINQKLIESFDGKSWFAYRGAYQLIRASRDIQAGDELLTDYTDIKTDSMRHQTAVQYSFFPTARPEGLHAA